MTAVQKLTTILLNPNNHRFLLAILSLSIAFLCASCVPNDNPKEVREFTSCTGEKYTLKVEARVSIGPSANHLSLSTEGEILVTESGSNTLSKIQKNVRKAYLDAGENRNPWASWADSKKIFLTNYLSNSLSEFTKEGILIKEWKEGFDTPSALVGNDAFLFVSNVAFEGSVFQKGFVKIFNRESRTWGKALPTQALNPQFLSLIHHQKKDVLVVVSSGTFEFTKEGTIPGSDAAIELWTIDKGTSEPIVSQVSYALPRSGQIGSPGRAVQIGNSLYFSSGTNPVIFEFDLIQKKWIHDTKNPIRLRSHLPEALHFSDAWAGLLFVSAFNEDGIYIVDPSCKKVSPLFPIDENEFLAGAHEIMIVPQSETQAKAYIILSLANALATLTIEKTK